MVKGQHEALQILYSLPSVFKTEDDLKNKTVLLDTSITIPMGFSGKIGIQKY